MYELQILYYYTISNVKYHKPESLKTQADDRVVSSIIGSDKVTENGGALSFRKQVHEFIFEHKIISKHPLNMRASLIGACTFVRGDTVCTVIIRSFQI